MNDEIQILEFKFRIALAKKKLLAWLIKQVNRPTFNPEKDEALLRQMGWFK